MKTFYIASRLENADQVRELRDLLVAAGMTCSYDWTVHGSVRGPDATSAEVRRVGEAEAQAAVNADLFVFLLPGGRGAHVELGLALAMGFGRVVLWSRDPGADFGLSEATSCFYHLEAVEQRADATMGDLAAYLLS